MVELELPGVLRGVSWKMPFFMLNGHALHFGAFARHMGIYPGPEAVTWFKERYPSTSKGSIRMPYDKPLPLEEIRALTLYLVSLSE